LSIWGEDERKPVPVKVKRAVYARAKGKCEKCGISLKINEGDFHHTRSPKVIPRASSVRFLCPTCHRRFGHQRVTRKSDSFFGSDKEVKLVRQKVVTIKKPKKKTKRVAVRGFFGEVIGYRTVKVKKPKKKKSKKKKKIKI